MADITYIDIQEDRNLSASLARYLAASVEQIYQYSGIGSRVGAYQNVFTQFDRFGYNVLMQNHEMAGLTFITRPTLNLHTSNLRMDSILATLASNDEKTLAFAMRYMLDTRLAGVNPQPGDKGASARRQLAATSPFLNEKSPFLIPLSNCLKSITGFPDLILDTYTTPGGYMSEDQSIALGSDMFARSFDLTLTFRDIPGGFIRAMLLYWIWWISLTTRGTVVPYPVDEAARLLCYTCSIYRLVLDATLTRVVAAAKATGCFPFMLPVGNLFNINERENYLSAGAEFSVQFKVNHFEAFDAHIFSDFNTLHEIFAGKGWWKTRQPLSTESKNNFRGLPRIDTMSGHNGIRFYATEQETANKMLAPTAELKKKIDLKAAEMATKKSYPIFNYNQGQQ